MFGQTIGKIETPLENLLAEETVTAAGKREVFITISTSLLPKTAQIAVGVADYCSQTPGIGQMCVDNPDSELLTFDRKYSDYFAEVRRQEPGEVAAELLYDFCQEIVWGYDGKPTRMMTTQPSVLCLGTNVFENPNHKMGIWYLLMSHRGIEMAFSVATGKCVGHPMKDLSEQATMGYLLYGNQHLIVQTKKRIIELAGEMPPDARGIMTLNDIAYVKEALTEFRFQANRKNQSRTT